MGKYHFSMGSYIMTGNYMYQQGLKQGLEISWPSINSRNNATDIKSTIVNV